jgi:serine O-acetyltransferase
MEMVDSLRAVLFPGYYSDWDLTEESLSYYVGSTLDRVLHTLQEQVKRGLCLFCDKHPNTRHACDERAEDITRSFLSRLPDLRYVLATDVQAHYEGDPAAQSYEEVVFSYPGLRAITDHRLAHELYLLGAPLIPRIISEYAHGVTGVDIHPGARIGEKFFIDHATGVVIGETAIIGKGVRIYQGVTLGAKSFPLDEEGKPIKGIDRHPIVEDDVIIYSGATILGRVTIGRGSVIGGNVWLTHSVPPGSIVTQERARHGWFEDGGGI